ncbi:hypothetical protein P152DRAFT_388836 [Eremomyces bilateralis CBS 781.70]|uniref:ferric-chelate reductase (NADPH) n=1 Tax=Eremomyces bilateralis CBS 781.70 TaxID=1392243 RepID=A0A6G1GDU6_9PEZI|nr:uncharacterized protein P152DRAFT_388836 [Eremomyces bilateralis CBS 781.70]KAF1816080.1 hypothetical protein P152DRAFT_388836 [Eremomyces bilateralis CBS 781.70]
MLKVASALLCFSSTVVLASGGSSGGGGGHDNTITPADTLNRSLVKDMYIAWSSIILALAIFTVVLFSSRYMRLIASVGTNQQAFFLLRNTTWGSVKRHLLDAPLFRKRHHREFKLSSVMNMGTLPSRFQMLFLIGYFSFQMLFCFYNIEWHAGQETILKQLISRTGILSVMNMLPLFLLAGRNNPLIPLCGITFDTFNLIHRWIGRISIIQAVIHTVAWMAKKVLTNGWPAVQASMSSMKMISGTIAMSGFLWILFTSPSAVRHAFYETFLHFHIIAAAMALGALWYHIAKEVWLRNILIGLMIIWIGERTLRIFRIIYRNFGNGGTQTTLELLPGDACRVTVRLARPWAFRPGQHAYLYIPSIGLWTSHPFTVAWSDEEVVGVTDEAGASNTSSMTTLGEKVLPITSSEVLSVHATTFSFICRKRTGFTEKMYRRVQREPSGFIHTWGIVEGPYGSQDLRSYGTVLLFAAGVGITHQVPHVRDLVAAYGNGTCATRKVTLVWVIQSPEHLEWIRKWMTMILALPKRRDILKILLFITRPKSNREIHSPSSSVQMMPGRPDIRRLITQEVDTAIGAVGVTCCGVGELADDVRAACRPYMTDRSVTFMEESFSW